jgi:hypothetical protein
MERYVRCGVEIIHFNAEEERYILSKLYLKDYLFFLPEKQEGIECKLIIEDGMFNFDLDPFMVSKIRFSNG